MKLRSTLVLAVSLLLLSSCSSREVVCPEGQTACGKACKSLLTDPENCGACGVQVAPLETCSNGAPACAQGPDVTTCDGACTDLARDPANCGACGLACDGATYCTTAGSETSCTAECPADYTACGRSCVQLTEDRFHCGACGRACARGEVCRDGGCRADLHVACLATNEIVSVSADLAAPGISRATPTGAGALALLGDALYAANGWPQASVSVFSLDAPRPRLDVVVDGNDLQAIVPHENVLLVTNSARGTLLVLHASGVVLDEIPLPEQQSYPNPHGVAVLGTTAYVALYEHSRIATVDLSGLSACAAPDPGAPACGDGGACPEGRGCVSGVCRLRCGVATGTLDLASIAGSHDAPGLPLPTGVVSALGRVYVSLANLADDPDDGYFFQVKPAGPGKIAVVEPAGPSVSIIDLGSACWKPGAMALRGTTLWVACGSMSFQELAPGALVPIELSSGTPVIGTPIDVSSVVPGKLAFCGGTGYLADQSSGKVVRFDPTGGTAESPVVVCPSGDYWTSVSDIACAP